MRAVILQPTFLPWVGWFDLADQADELVILDDVGFSKQSWQQRNRLRTPRGLEYATVPVRTAGRLGQAIAEVELAGDAFAGKLEKTVAANYARAAHFDEHFDGFRAALRRGAATGRLAGLNQALIDWLGAVLGITTPQRRSGELPVDGKRGAYVARLCEHLGADRYLSPAGAADYLREDQAEFERRGIAVELHAYEPAPYRQAFAPFLPYASTLDLVLNEGARSAAIMRAGRRPSLPLAAATAAPDAPPPP